MSYFITDVKKLYKSQMVKWLLIFLAAIMTLDPISHYVTHIGIKTFVEYTGTDPFQYWLLMHSSHWGGTVYYALIYVFPVISTGLILYYERCSSVFEFSVIRGSRIKYYLSKTGAVFVMTFLNFFAALTVNVIITYLIYPADNPLTQQYTYIIPKEGMFSYPFYQRNPLCMVILYTFLNALVIALYALFSLALHAIIRFRNRYAAALVPFLALYLINYSVGLLLKGHLNQQLSILIQPQAASALVQIIRGRDVLMAFLTVLLLDAILLVIGYVRNKETL